MARFGLFLGCLLAVGCGDSLETISAGADAGDDAAETSIGGSGGGTGGSDASPDAKPNVDQACEHESDCVGGSSCLARSRSMGALGCTAATQACSFVCTVDSDCASYGDGLKCQPGCNGLPNTCVVP